MSFAIIALNSGAVVCVEARESCVLEQVVSSLNCLGIRSRRALEANHTGSPVLLDAELEPSLWILVSYSPRSQARIAEVRRLLPTVLIYVVSASGEDPEEEEASALLHGADGFSAAPLKQAAFAAKVFALLRRAFGEVPPTSPKSVALDAVAHRLLVNDRAFFLTPREYSLVAYLRARTGEWITRDELLRDVFGACAVGYDSSLVRTHIFNLRKKLGPEGWVIRTHRSRGVMLLAPTRSDVTGPQPTLTGGSPGED